MRDGMSTVKSWDGKCLTFLAGGNVGALPCRAEWLMNQLWKIA
ncbi:hypothetical protein AB0J13_07975 [Streptomyces anulatus]